MSKLPVIKTPSFTTTLPSGRIIKYSMFTKKDEKALLYLKETDDKNARINILADLVEERTGGSVDPKKDPKWLIEYVYMLLRRDSIEPVIEFKIATKDGTPKDAVLDLNEMSLLNVDEEFTGKIDMSEFTNEKTIVQFKEPTIFDYYTTNDAGEDNENEILWNCFEATYSGSETIAKDDLKKEDFFEWIESLSVDAYQLINKEFNKITVVETVLIIEGKEQRLNDLLNFLILP